jgi:hypothetical protein
MAQKSKEKDSSKLNNFINFFFKNSFFLFIIIKTLTNPQIVITVVEGNADVPKQITTVDVVFVKDEFVVTTIPKVTSMVEWNILKSMSRASTVRNALCEVM